MKKFLSILIISLIVVLLSTGVSAANYPLEYSDDLNREIIIDKEVERIISLAPGVTEMIYALGLEDKLIAVSSACDYPAEAKEKQSVGRTDEPNIEKIVALDPDLLIAESLTKIEVLKRLSELGIKNIGFKPESINDTIEMIEDIAYLTSSAEKGEELVSELRNEYQQLGNKVNKRLENRDRPRVFYALWQDPLYTAGKNTFIDNLIFEAGGYNIGREAEGSWPIYSRESLIAADPEVYISASHSGKNEISLEQIKAQKVFRGISAFKNDRIYLVNPDLVNRPSPRIIEGLKEFIRAIHPGLIKNSS